MLTTVSGSDVVRAYQILFSPSDPFVKEAFSLSFVKRLDPSTVRSAFRKKALETHPDRAKVSGRGENEQADLFRQVKQAYEVLLPVAERCSAVEVKARVSAKPAGAEKKEKRAYQHAHDQHRRTFNGKPRRTPSFYYNGLIPGHRLRLGHYLYYSGIISWQNLVNAVAFHMRSKPRYGEIALGWSMITPEELAFCLSQRLKGEKIGECLKRSELISDFQHLAILGKQRKFHCLFGAYFVNEGILSQRQLDIAVRRAVLHNKSVEGMRFGYKR